MIFCIEVSTSDPTMRQGCERGKFAYYNVTGERSKAAAQSRTYLQRGYRVEVYDAETKELLGGPFDPDSPEPVYIV